MDCIGKLLGHEGTQIGTHMHHRPNFHDENTPIEQGNYRRYFRYLDSQRKSALIAPSDPDVSGTEPATPMPPRRPPISLEVLVSLTDSTWNPDLHRGLDYLWTIMDESERNAFLESITTEPTSTSMSTVVPMPAKAAQPAIKPLQPQPPQERQDQRPGSTAMDDQQGNSGILPIERWNRLDKIPISSRTNAACCTNGVDGTWF